MSDFTPVHNHLVIGLGGTGGKIIRDLRKIIESDTSPRGDVNFEYLYMDTGSDIIKETAQWRVLGKTVELAQSQYLLSTAADLRPVLDNLEAYVGLKHWVQPRSAFDNVDSGTANAGQRRKLGRVLFARNAEKFMNMVKDRVRVLTSIQNANNLSFHIVCGLAGGTGSGSVIDVVSLLRDTYPDAGRNWIIVYAFLPEKDPSFGDENGRYYANGYAALTELNALAVGAYQPYNVITGERVPKHDIFFNSCYLVNNENERGTVADVQKELPRIVAEFLYQKTLGLNWQGLDRAEKSENGNNDPECAVDDTKTAERSKRFITFGIKRVVVPEDEIRESLTYSFAKEVTSQLMFNNWRDGVGYAEEERSQDYQSYVRQPDQINRWHLSDDHLTLSIGILPDDASNARWKKIGEFWTGFIATQKQDIKSEISKQRWLDELIKVCEDMYDNSYRNLGGVRKFYETKAKARDEIAAHMVRDIERELFGDWRNGHRSLAEARKVIDTLFSSLDERLKNIDSTISRVREQEQTAARKKSDLVTEWSRVGFISDLLGKGEKLFNSAAENLIDIYTCRTAAESWSFAKKLLEAVMTKLTELRFSVDQMQQRLAKATLQFHKGIDSRLQKAESSFQERLFNTEAIEQVRKALILDELAQKSRIQQVRVKIIEKAGPNVDSFARLNDKVGEESLIAVLEEGAKETVTSAHNELAATTKKVLGVNIVERLYEEFAANDEDLRRYVKDIINSSGVFLTFEPAEEDKGGIGTDGYPKHKKTSGLFLPACKEKQAFRTKLADLFEANKLSEDFHIISEGARDNELVMVRLDNLFPLRFAKPLGFLRQAYNRLLKDKEREFLHGEGSGEHLPPLYIPSAEAVADGKRHYVVLARLLGLLVDRPNVATGRMETVLRHDDADGLPAEKIVGSSFDETLATRDVGLITAIATQVIAVLDGAKFRHVDQKNAAFDNYRHFITDVLAAVGGNLQDPKYVLLRTMTTPIKEALKLV